MLRAQERREVVHLGHSVAQRISASLEIEILDTPNIFYLSRLYNPMLTPYYTTVWLQAAQQLKSAAAISRPLVVSC